MKRHDGPISDEVSVRILTVRTMTPGAGVDPNKVIRPSKRLRNWHRAPTHGLAQIPLKLYARNLASSEGISKVLVESKAVAKRWLASKGVRP